MASNKRERFVSVCCECGKVRVGERWMWADVAAFVGAQLTHGYCPACFRRALMALASAPARAQPVSHAG